MLSRFLLLCSLVLSVGVAEARFGDVVVFEDTSFANPPPPPTVTLTLDPSGGAEPTMTLDIVMQNNCSHTTTTGGSDPPVEVTTRTYTSVATCPDGYDTFTSQMCVPPAGYLGPCHQVIPWGDDAFSSNDPAADRISDYRNTNLGGGEVFFCGLIFEPASWASITNADGCPRFYGYLGGSPGPDCEALYTGAICPTVHAITNSGDFDTWATEWVNCAVAATDNWYQQVTITPGAGDCPVGWTSQPYERCVIPFSGMCPNSDYDEVHYLCVWTEQLSETGDAQGNFWDLRGARHVRPGCDYTVPMDADINQVDGNDILARMNDIERCGYMYQCSFTGFDDSNPANRCPAGYTVDEPNSRCLNASDPTPCGELPMMTTMAASTYPQFWTDAGANMANQAIILKWGQCSQRVNCTTYADTANCPVGMMPAASNPYSFSFNDYPYQQYCIQNGDAYINQGITGRCWDVDKFELAEMPAREHELEECAATITSTSYTNTTTTFGSPGATVCDAREQGGFWSLSWFAEPNITDHDTCSNLKARSGNYAGYGIRQFTDPTLFPTSFDATDSNSLEFVSTTPYNDLIDYDQFSIEGTINNFWDGCDPDWATGEPWSTQFYIAYVQNITNGTAGLPTTRSFTYSYNMSIAQLNGAWVSSTSFASAQMIQPTILSILSQRSLTHPSHATITIHFSLRVPNDNGEESAMRLAWYMFVNQATGTDLVGLAAPFDNPAAFPAMTAYGTGGAMPAKCTAATTGSCEQQWTLTMNVTGAVDSSNRLRISATHLMGIEVYDQGTAMATALRTETVQLPITMILPSTINSTVVTKIETAAFTATDAAGNTFDLTDNNYKTVPNDIITIKTQLQSASLRETYDVAARLLIICLANGVTVNAPTLLTADTVTGNGCFGASTANRAVIYQDSTWLTNNGYGSIVQGGDRILTDPAYMVNSTWDNNAKQQILSFKNIFLSGAAQQYVYTAIFEVADPGQGARRLIASSSSSSSGASFNDQPQHQLNALTVAYGDCPLHSHYQTVSLDCACNAFYVYNTVTQQCDLDQSAYQSPSTFKTMVLGFCAGLIALAVILASLVFVLQRQVVPQQHSNKAAAIV